MSDGILRFSNAEGVTAYNRYNNFLTNYGDFGALQRIEYRTGTANGVEIAFTNIPQTFQDLRLVISAIPSNSSTVLGTYFNGTTANTCSCTWLVGNGSNAVSSRNTSQTTVFPSGYAIATSNPTSITMDILNYRNTTTFKTVLTRMASDQNGSGYTLLSVGLCQTTSAISTITLSTLNPSYFWTTSTTAALYGVRASAS